MSNKTNAQAMTIEQFALKVREVAKQLGVDEQELLRNMLAYINK